MENFILLQSFKKFNHFNKNMRGSPSHTTPWRQVKGQFAGIHFLTPSCSPGDQAQVLRLDSKQLYPLSHLAGFTDIFYKG